MSQPYMECFEGARDRRQRELFCGRDTRAFARTVSTCFEILEFQMPVGQLDMVGWQVNM